MAVQVCTVCSTGFSARAGAVYCSSARRQRAHRARVSRRFAALEASIGQSGMPASPLDGLAELIERARQAIHRSEELCDAAAAHRAHAAVRRSSSASPSNEWRTNEDQPQHPVALQPRGADTSARSGQSTPPQSA
ncbi:hypothetical protein [Mycobacteroides abscessus]|uniref:hypothetical protein n=1 Tax=Mycobacteroides abscessus TaxID=36809 RepID=UPI0019D0FDF8|nr:hypothetical protein [Mycobacteroides abscessus]MBN7374588.1 hypothetical protein [Mycobacteroides abscessus subsp. abscessus]